MPGTALASSTSDAHGSESPRPIQAVGRALSATLCGLVTVTLLANAGAIFFIIPRLVVSLDDFEIALPGLTVWLIKARTITAVMSVLLALVMIVKEVVIRQPAPKLIINAVIFSLTMATVVVTIIGLFLPLVKLTESMT